MNERRTYKIPYSELRMVLEAMLKDEQVISLAELFTEDNDLETHAPVREPSQLELYFNRDEEPLEEGLKDFIKVSVVAGLFAMPGIIKAADVVNNLPSAQTEQVSRTDLDNALQAAVRAKTTFSGYSIDKAANIIARTLYMEAANQGNTGQLAIMSVIWNRAGGDCQKLIPVCFKRGQFCGWNKAKPSTTSGSYSASNYQLWIPPRLIQGGVVNPIENKVWENCKRIASDVLTTGDFHSIIGHCNMIINPQMDNAEFKKHWLPKAEFEYKDHKFAYDSYWDPKAETKTAEPQQKKYVVDYTPSKDATHTEKVFHTVEAGDTLSQIAVDLGTTVKHIRELNPKDTKNPDKIKVGAKLYIGYRAPEK